MAPEQCSISIQYQHVHSVYIMLCVVSIVLCVFCYVVCIFMCSVYFVVQCVFCYVVCILLCSVYFVVQCVLCCVVCIVQCILCGVYYVVYCLYCIVCPGNKSVTAMYGYIGKLGDSVQCISSGQNTKGNIQILLVVLEIV